MLDGVAMRNREQTFLEGSRQRPGTDDEILQRRINELGLKLEGSVLEILLRELEYELVKRGITKVKPAAYLTDEWGCPEGVPIIGIPYYLADERLKAAANEVCEGETESEILKYLRHEMGHVFNYAYRLYTRSDWNELFGPYSRPYVENYSPRPFSRDYVRHIAGWYAQKHPDEDWSETFAVWLTPGSDWETAYGAGALKKLKYIDRIVRELGSADPAVSQPGEPFPNAGSIEDLTYTVGEHIERYRESKVEVPPYFDADLKEFFDGRPEREDSESAGDFLRRHRKTIVKRVSHWTGVREGVVGSLIDHLIERATALGLIAERRRTARRLIDIIAYATTLSMNFLYQGTFFPGTSGDAGVGKGPAVAAAVEGTAPSTVPASASTPPSGPSAAQAETPLSAAAPDRQPSPPPASDRTPIA